MAEAVPARRTSLNEGLNNGRSSPAQEQDGREESLHWRALLRPREQVGRSRRTCPDACEVDVGFGVRNDMGLVGGVVAGAEMAAGDGWGGGAGKGREGTVRRPSYPSILLSSYEILI
jgi:hypothetical protein